MYSGAGVIWALGVWAQLAPEQVLANTWWSFGGTNP